MLFKPVLLCLGVAWACGVSALGVSPTRLVFDAQSPQRQDLQLMNDRSDAVAVELRLVRRRANVANSELEPAETGQLTLSLPQTLIAGQRAQTVTVQRQVREDSCRGCSFYLVIETLPIALEAPEVSGQLSIASRFYVPVHVVPGAYDQLEGEIAPAKQQFRLSNSGQSTVLFSTFQVEVFDARNAQWLTVPGSDIARLVRSDAVLAGEKWTLDLADLLPEGDYTRVRFRASAQAGSGQH